MLPNDDARVLRSVHILILIYCIRFVHIVVVFFSLCSTVHYITPTTIICYVNSYIFSYFSRGRARLCKESSVGSSGESRAARTDWVKCEGRHVFARSNEDLGEKRPFTGWSER